MISFCGLNQSVSFMFILIRNYWTNEYMRWSFFLFMLLKVKALLFIYCDRMENVPDDLASDNVAEVDVSGKYIDAVDLERRMWKDRVRLKRIKERTNKTGSQAKRPRRSLTNKTVVNSDNDVDGTEEASGSLTATSQPVRDQDKAEKHRRRKRPRSRSEAEQRNVIPDMNHVDASART